MWVHLLDCGATDNPLEVTSTPDTNNTGDDLAGQGTFLNHWHNLSSQPKDITYSFDPSQLTALSAYLSDGNFGLGFDPDCHDYNSGITLTIETAHAPVPASLLLLGSGLLGLVGLKRKGPTTA